MKTSMFYIAVGGFFGAIFRFILSQALNQKFGASFPIGTLFVNLIGSFLLGFIIGKGISSDLDLLFGVGFMGAFTTFSTLKLENVEMIKKKKYRMSFYYLVISYLGGLSLAYVGWWAGTHIFG